MTLLVRLRTETRQAHDRIEDAVDLTASLASLPAYRALLRRLYGFHAVWDEEARAAIPDPALLDGRLRAKALARDLRVLGESADSLGRLPRPAAVLREKSLPEALGALYVMEGSTLGGAVIAVEARRRLGLDAANGCAFFAGAGRDLKARWTAFRDRLTAYSSPERDDRIVAAANETFERMRLWMIEGAAA